jgi:hypothetical protein
VTIQPDASEAISPPIDAVIYAPIGSEVMNSMISIVLLYSIFFGGCGANIDAIIIKTEKIAKAVISATITPNTLRPIRLLSRQKILNYRLLDF